MQVRIVAGSKVRPPGFEPGLLAGLDGASWKANVLTRLDYGRPTLQVHMDPGFIEKWHDLGDDRSLGVPSAFAIPRTLVLLGFLGRRHVRPVRAKAEAEGRLQP